MEILLILDCTTVQQLRWELDDNSGLIISISPLKMLLVEAASVAKWLKRAVFLALVITKSFHCHGFESGLGHTRQAKVSLGVVRWFSRGSPIFAPSNGCLLKMSVL